MKKIVLADGKEFKGEGFGADREVIMELVFNTSCVGYQEIVSDPSYTDQMVVMTYPLIGNYGITDDDYESRGATVGGLVVREYNDRPSNFRYTKTLSEVLADAQIPGISGVDTREITRIIRDEGSQLAMICDESVSNEEAVKRIRDYVYPTNQVEKVSSTKKWYSRTANPKYNIVAVDCGIKHNIIRSLNALGANVTVVPYTITEEELWLLKPDGLFLSNGPGNPEDVTPVIDLIKHVQGKLPIFGICLGHQMIALANGLKTYKMKFGHRGGNHPVKNLETNKIEITSQNHSYAVDMNSCTNKDITFTHINLLDNTVEGLEIKKDHVFSVQYHPESAPGPEDSGYLFKKFIGMIEECKKGGAHNA